MSRSIERQIKRQQALADFRYRKGIENHVVREIGKNASVADCHPDIREMFRLVGLLIEADDFGHFPDTDLAIQELRALYRKYEPRKEKELTDLEAPAKVVA